MTALPDVPAPDPASHRTGCASASSPTGPDRRRCGCPPGRRCSTPRAGTASRSTRRAAGTARAASARCGSSRGTWPVSRLDPRAFDPDELRAGWRLACRARAEQDLRVEVPPLVTRPKAATVGVGRQVILRPAVQKRCVTLRRADAVRPAHRPGTAARRARPTSSCGSTCRRCGTCPGRCAPLESDESPRSPPCSSTTCSSTSSPATPPGALFGIAFDLGTTTVVATLLDLATGHAGRRRVAAQPPAALRRRRDHPDQRDDDGPRRARPADRARPPGAWTSSRARCAPTAASTAPRSTRSRSPATRR